MNIIMVSDCHITSSFPVARQDTALETCMVKVTHLLAKCVQHKAILLTAGDLFQNDRDWGALTRVAEMLNRCQPTVQVFTIPGQHDKHYRTKAKATNLGVLENAGLVTILGETPYTFEHYAEDNSYKFIVRIYGAGWGEPWPVPEEVISHTYDILVVHAPISTKSLYPDHQYQDAKDVLKANPKYDIILCGDTHRYFKVPFKRGAALPSAWCLNTGPMFRREATEYNMGHKPGYFLWQDGAVNWCEIPHEAADVVLSRAHLTTGTLPATSMADFTAKIKGRGTIKRATLRERVLAKIKAGRPHPRVANILKEVMGIGSK